jgi:hypothetical protein
MAIIKIPAKLQSLLWSANTNSLDIAKDKNYIIHQIFCYGSLNDFRWLFQTYAKSEIIDIFVNHPYKDYSPHRFNFVKNIILDLRSYHFNPRLYVKNIPRDIRR